MIAHWLLQQAALPAPCREDVTWRWVAILATLLMLVVFWTAINVLHDVVEEGA